METGCGGGLLTLLGVVCLNDDFAPEPVGGVHRAPGGSFAVGNEQMVKRGLVETLFVERLVGRRREWTAVRRKDGRRQKMN